MKSLVKMLSGILAAGSLFCCAKPEPAKPESNVPKVPFEKFRMVVSNSSALMRVFEGERTADGVTLVYAHEFMGPEDRRTVIREVKGGKELQAKIDSLWVLNKVSSWNGFRGPNPPGVLDGGGFRFEAKMADGSSIDANGTNNYPKGYGDFREGIYDLTAHSILDSTNFVGKYFQLTLPESWVGLVQVGYSEDGYSFTIPRKKGDVYLMRIDMEYSCADDGKKVCLGKIKDQDLFIVFVPYGNKYFQKDLDENQWKAYSDYEQNKDSLVNSLVALPGFEIEKPLPK